MSSAIASIRNHPQFDEMHYWEDLGVQSCAHWLNSKCGFGMNSARERLCVAHALGGLPKIREKFSEGAISYSKVLSSQ